MKLPPVSLRQRYEITWDIYERLTRKSKLCDSHMPSNGFCYDCKMESSSENRPWFLKIQKDVHNARTTVKLLYKYQSFTELAFGKILKYFAASGSKP